MSLMPVAWMRVSYRRVRLVAGPIDAGAMGGRKGNAPPVTRGAAAHCRGRTGWSRAWWSRALALTLGTTVFALSGCMENSANGGDGGIGGDGTVVGRCPGGVDPSVDIATAIVLAAGTPVTGYICPRTDKDFFKIVVPEGHKLLDVQLNLAAPTSPIQLSYLILNEAGRTVGTSPRGQNNQFKALHCIEPGSYYLQVQDEGNDGEDAKNAYTLRYETRPDPDSGEPANNDPATAPDATSTQEGLISCTGDVDYYKVRVPTNQLLRLRLTTQTVTPVVLKYTVLTPQSEGMEPLVSGAFTASAREPTLLETLTALPAAGTDYLLRIEDAAGTQSDADTPYTLEVSTRPEPDTNDVTGGRNDHPNAATALALPAAGSCYAGSVSGRIASQGDVDYFRIDSPIEIGSNPGLIEIDLAFPKSTRVDPSFGLVYVTTKACSTDKCCQVLDEPTGSCAGVMDCIGSSSVCQAPSAAYCADPACVGPSPNLTCETNRKCAGSVTCIGGRCGATQFFRNGQDGGRLLAAHPIMHPGGPWYIRVADVGNDEYDYDTNYTLRVKVCRDPDGARDNAYFPRLVWQRPPCSGGCDPIVMAEGVEASTIERFFADGITRKSLGNFIPVPNVTEPNPDPDPVPYTWSPWIEGHIAYEHDTDHYSFANPCKAISGLAEASCMLEIQYRVTGSDCPTGPNGSGLEFIFALRKGRTGGNDFEVTGLTGPEPITRGYPTESNQCRIMLRRDSSDTLTLDVSDRFHNNWSPTCKYQVRFRVSHLGCPASETGGGPCNYSCGYAGCTEAPKCWTR